PSLPDLHTPSLHDALPICHSRSPTGDLGAALPFQPLPPQMLCSFLTALTAGSKVEIGLDHRCTEHALSRDNCITEKPRIGEHREDRKSTHLNSSHVKISYA